MICELCGWNGNQLNHHMRKKHSTEAIVDLIEKSSGIFSADDVRIIAVKLIEIAKVSGTFDSGVSGFIHHLSADEESPIHRYGAFCMQANNAVWHQITPLTSTANFLFMRRSAE